MRAVLRALCAGLPAGSRPRVRVGAALLQVLVLQAKEDRRRMLAVDVHLGVVERVAAPVLVLDLPAGDGVSAVRQALAGQVSAGLQCAVCADAGAHTRAQCAVPSSHNGSGGAVEYY